MTLDTEVQNSISQIPECLAAGCVDVSTGMLLSVKTVDSHPGEVLDLLSAATGDLFQGPNVVAVDDLFKKSRGSDSKDHYFQEMVVLSENLVHVFLRGKAYTDHVMTFVCRKSVNLGMALTKARMVAPRLEAAIRI